MNVAAYRHVLAIRDTRRILLLGLLVRVPMFAGTVILTLHVVSSLGRSYGQAGIVTAAATLHASGKTDIQTSAEAAQALRPIAGAFSEAIFALGIVGTGLLAIPVLAGATAYAVGEGRRWPVGLARRPKEAAAFYAVLALSAGIGIALNFMPIEPISALYWSAVINGVLYSVVDQS